MTESLTTPYVIGDVDQVEYVCKYHAHKFAEWAKLTWANANYTEEHNSGYFAYAVASYEYPDTDYPLSCGDLDCDQYLECDLTEDGKNYMHDNEFPAWLYEAHGLYEYSAGERFFNEIDELGYNFHSVQAAVKDLFLNIHYLSDEEWKETKKRADYLAGEERAMRHGRVAIF